MNFIITGASKGVGFELALLLVKQGHDVIALARSQEKLAKLQHQAKSEKGVLSVLVFDIVNEDVDGKLFPFIKAKFEHIDVLLNNAGALVNKPLTEITPDDYNKMLDTNLKAPFFLIQKLKSLLKSGSHVVNIGSMGGFQGSAKFPGLSIYSASKGALATLSECLAEELKDEGIKVNCLALGAAQTEMLEQAFPGFEAPLSANEMANFIAEFSINGSKYFNGKVVPVSVSTP